MSFNESDYELACEYTLDEEDRNSAIGRYIKNAWIIGPSKAVKSFGKIILEDKAPSSSNKSTSNTKSNTDDNKKESYSIFNSNLSLRYNTKFEADGKSSSEVPVFSSFTVKVGIEGNGYTEWKVLLKNLNALIPVKTAIKAGAFKEAYNFASNDKESDGLIVVSVKTFIANNTDTRECLPPFMGHCRYGFDAGSEDTNIDANTICLAIAPIDAKNNKPSQDLIFRSTYSVVGDITDGILGDILNFAKDATKKVGSQVIPGLSSGSDRRYSDDKESDEQKATNKLSDFLHKKFKCVGDQNMYPQFKQICDYIKRNVSNKRLEYMESESTNPVAYKNQINDGSLIFF